MLMGLVGVGIFVAAAMGISLPFIPETHGTVTVTLSKRFALDLPHYASGVAWSPDGRTLAVTSHYNSILTTYDSAGHPLNSFQSHGNKGGYFNSFGFINGSSQMLFPIESRASLDAAIDIRDVATGQIVKTITRAKDKNYAPNATDDLAVSTDQKRFAIGNGILQGFLVYGTDDGRQWHELSAVGRHEFGATSFCFFRDNRLLAVGQGDGHFMVVDSTTGKTLKDFQAYDAPGIHDDVYGIAVSPKGDMILTGIHGVAIDSDATPAALAWYRSNHAVAQVWRVSDGKEVAGFPDKDRYVEQAAWDPKGRFVAFIDTDSLIIWQPQTAGMNYQRIKLSGLSASLAVTPDGDSLAVAGGNIVTVYNIADK
jgi:WD40 repeat protein